VFVQLGITETEDRTAGSTAQQYDGFWSDTSRHFHPIQIASLKTGDEISVEMQLESAGWVLHFEDVSTVPGRSSISLSGSRRIPCLRPTLCAISHTHPCRR
jgi:hypothetical protein